MGNFIKLPKGKCLAINSDLFHATSSKLREYYCSYKSICENFVISIPEYIQIFGHDVKSFQIWDTEKSGFLNAFQIFTGLIIFSQIIFEEKIRFIYELYDLNEEGFLDYESLLFIFETACSATLKLYRIQDCSWQTEINEYLDEYFTQQTQIRYEQFLAWCYRTYEIPEYFRNIGLEFPIKKKNYQICKFIPNKNSPSEGKTYQHIPKYKVMLDNRFMNMLKTNRIIQDNLDKTTDFNPYLKWIYGITIKNITNPLHYLIEKDHKSSNEKFIYVSGKNVVLFYPKLNQQKIYSFHEKPVSVVQVSSNKDIVATGEFGVNPNIHIWSLKSLKTLLTLERVHKTSIKHLNFIKNNSHLLTAAERENTPIILINLITQQRILSTFMDFPILKIITADETGMRNISPKQKNVNIQQKSKSKKLDENSPSHSDYFFIVCRDSVSIYQYEQSDYVIKHKKSIANGLEFTIADCIGIGTSSGNQMTSILIADDNQNFWLYQSSSNQFIKLQFINKKNGEVRNSLYDETGSKIKEIVSLVKSQEKSMFYILEPHSITQCKIAENLENTESVCMGDINFHNTEHNSIPLELIVLQRINQINQSLYNGELIQLIEIDKSNLIIISQMGDTIKFQNFDAYQEQSDYQSLGEDEDEGVKKVMRSNFKKYHQIFNIDKITDICFLSTDEAQLDSLLIYENSSMDKYKQNLLICCQNLLYQIDQKERELIKLTQYSQRITHIDSYEKICAVVFANKKIGIIKNGTVAELGKKIDNLYLISQDLNEGEEEKLSINAIKLTRDYLVVTTNENFLLIFSKSGGEYLSADPKKIKIETGTPIHISSTTTNKIFLVMTKQKLMLKLDLESKDKNFIYSAKQINCDSLCTLYPQNVAQKLPILFSESKSIYLLAQPSGEIFFWNSLAHILNQSSSYSILSGHSSMITKLMFHRENSGFFSAGSEDCLVIEWGNQETIIEQEIEEQSELKFGKFKKKEDNNNKAAKTKINQKKYGAITKQYKQQAKYLKEEYVDSEELRDTTVAVLVKNSQNYRGINKIINNILIPQNLQLFEPLMQKKKMQSSHNMHLTKKPTKNSLNIQLNYVYGFSSEQIRQTIFYGHQHPSTKKQQNNKISSFVTKQQKINFGYINKKLEPIDAVHQNCKRLLVYFTGKLCVVACPQTKSQQFYTHHKKRVTALAISHCQMVICSAEISNHKAKMHLWKFDTLSLIEQIETSHAKFITKIQFSGKGQNLLSLGGAPQCHTLQIHDVKSGKSIAFRRIQNCEVYDLHWDPYSSEEFAICGNAFLSIYRISNKSLVRIEKCTSEQQEEDITCMMYTSNIYGNNIESDIITGNNFGDLSMFICGKYIKCKKNAHTSIINCLRITELFKYKIVLISAGEDYLVKLWDMKFREIGRISTQQKGLGMAVPQSIDIYGCLENNKKTEFDDKKLNKAPSQQQGLLLIGTRNGSIIQVKINEQYCGLAQYSEKENAEETGSKPIEQVIKFNSILQFTGFPSSCTDQINFDIRENYMLTYFHKNSLINIWDIHKNQIVKEFKVSGFPSVAKFSNTNLIAIGYFDGRIQFYEFFSEDVLNLKEEKIVLDPDQYPTKIVFSGGDLRFAVVSTQRQFSQSFPNSAFFSDYEPVGQNFQNDKIIIFESYMSKTGTTVNNSLVVNSEGIKIQRYQVQNPTDLNYVYWLQFNSQNFANQSQIHRYKKSNHHDRTYSETEASKSLLICYTKEDYRRLNNKSKNKLFSDSSSSHQELYKFVLYDFMKQTEKQIINEDFDTINFAPAIEATFKLHNFYLQNGGQSLNNQLQPQKSAQKKPNKSDFTQGLIETPIYKKDKEKNRVCFPFCKMTQYLNFTILGSVDGDVFILKSQYFYSEISQTQTQSLSTKTIRCFTSPITNLEVINNQLYVTAKDSGTILRYSLQLQQQQNQNRKQNSVTIHQSGRGNHEISQSRETKARQKLSKQYKHIKQIFPRRKQFYECKINSQQFREMLNEDLNKSEKKSGGNNTNDYIQLEVKHILGRRAFDKNNNVFIDLKENIISFSGCNLCLNRYDHVIQKYRQEFIKPDSSVFCSNPQISTILLAGDKKTLYIGTSEEHSQILIWDISTQTNFDNLIIHEFISIDLIKISPTQKHGAFLATHKTGKSFLLFISFKNKKIQACFQLYDNKQNINDLCFFPGEEYKFLACGNNYIAQWSCQSSILYERQYSTDNPKNFIEFASKSEDEQKIFHSAIFVGDIAVTSGSDGFLYLWNNKKLIKKQNAHPKAAILCLFVSHDSYVFASGGTDGKAIVWQLGENFMIQKIFQFNTYDGKDSLLPTRYHIQSVSIGKNDIFLGTRSGDIYQFNWSLQAESQNSEQKTKGNNYSTVLSAFDDDEVNSCSFNISSKKLFILTQSGSISVINLETFEKVNEQKIGVMNGKIVRMLTSKLSNKIFIVLKKGIEIYQYQENQKSGTKKPNRFKKLKESLKYPSSEIKAAVLSLNEKYMALLIAPNHLQNSKIEIYDLGSPDDKNFYLLYKVLEHIPENIEIIDFSTDNGFLLYKNPDEDETIIDLTTKQIINMEQIEFELQWNQLAKKTNGLTRNICSVYSDDNKLQNVLQIMNHSIIATDQMGSIRLFKQTNDQNCLGYYKIYLQHLNDVFMAIISSDCKILVTVGREDKAIVLWEIKNFDISQ